MTTATKKDYAVSLLTPHAANAFASLNMDREEREASYANAVHETVGVIGNCFIHHIYKLWEELEHFNKDNWVIGDECGSAVMMLKRNITGNKAEGKGELEVALKETGEIWARLLLDDVQDERFHDFFLKGKDLTLLELLNEGNVRDCEEYGFTRFTYMYQGKDLLAK